MPERLVDVEKQGSKVLHTFPNHDQRPRCGGGVQGEGVGSGGQCEVGPQRGTRESERQDACQPRRPTDPIRRSAWCAGRDQGGPGPGRSRARLFALGASGRPDGRAGDFWHQAQHQRFSERAYALWEREGCPEGKADEHWLRIRAFEEI